MAEPKPGDIVILSGPGYEPEYHGALAYIDNRGYMDGTGNYGVTELWSPKPFGIAGAALENIEIISHIPELAQTRGERPL